MADSRGVGGGGTRRRGAIKGSIGMCSCEGYGLQAASSRTGDINQALVVQRPDNAIHRINHYPADSVVCFVNTYLLDSNLSGG